MDINYREKIEQGINRILLHNLVKPRDRSCYLNPESSKEYQEWLRREVEENLLSIPLSEGKACDMCSGVGIYCVKCRGSGKLPPVTIEDVIKEKSGENNKS